jgi:hypothetical protein
MQFGFDRMAFRTFDLTFESHRSTYAILGLVLADGLRVSLPKKPSVI